MRRANLFSAMVAQFFLFTAAYGNIVEFVLVQPLSSITSKATLTGPALGGTVGSVPQAPGADTTTFYGSFYVDFQPGTIQLLAGGSISAAINGNWAPFDPVISDPPGPPAQGTQPGNYGLAIPAIGMVSNQYGLVLDFGAPGMGLPSTPVAIDGGGNFALAGQAMQFIAGRQALVTVLGNDTDDVIGFPTIFSTNGADVGNWNAGLQVLTIPIHSKFTFNVTSDFGGINQSSFMTGQLVAIPKVPEPSTLILGGIGIISLLALAWRKRRV